MVWYLSPLQLGESPSNGDGKARLVVTYFQQFVKLFSLSLSSETEN